MAGSYSERKQALSLSFLFPPFQTSNAHTPALRGMYISRYPCSLFSKFPFHLLRDLWKQATTSCRFEVRETLHASLNSFKNNVSPSPSVFASFFPTCSSRLLEKKKQRHTMMLLMLLFLLRLGNSSSVCHLERPLIAESIMVEVNPAQTPTHAHTHTVWWVVDGWLHRSEHVAYIYT